MIDTCGSCRLVTGQNPASAYKWVWMDLFAVASSVDHDAGCMAVLQTCSVPVSKHLVLKYQLSQFQ